MATGFVQWWTAEFKIGFYAAVTWFAVKKKKIAALRHRIFGFWISRSGLGWGAMEGGGGSGRRQVDENSREL